MRYRADITAGSLKAPESRVIADLWRLVRDGTGDAATHVVLAAAVKHSLLLGDFLDLVVREQCRIFAKTLSKPLWDQYLDDCRGRDPDMPVWNESTRNRLRSSPFPRARSREYSWPSPRSWLARILIGQNILDRNWRTEQK